MQLLRIQHLSAIAGALVIASAGLHPALADGPVTVTVNGSTVNLSPAPTERTGRVFVPLRGVFENLGATVVYDNGNINATSRGHAISLRVGSQQATVDGQQQTIDVAPFIIGASTYVPLRFISQALGAHVNYDGNNNQVAITMNAMSPRNETITPVARNDNELSLQSVTPGRGSTVNSRRPTIEAFFGERRADPNSLRVYVDRVDVTQNATRSPGGIAYAPQNALEAGSHTIRVTGVDASGQSFDRSWEFSSGSNSRNTSIDNVRPGSDAMVSNRFTVTGHTSPNAAVVIQIGSSNEAQSNSMGAIIGRQDNGGWQQNSTMQMELSADSNGYFSQRIDMGAAGGSNLLMVIHSTDQETGAAATPFRENLRVQ
ncbi:MAG: copper amine oxidase N-terminal domain-containing protein [Vulcanimicrobiaceae bacterium]|jgi:hypothetical protein